MAAILKRAQRSMFIVIAGLLGFSLFVPIVALGNGDLVSGDTAIISTGGGDATLRAEASYSASSIGAIPDGSEVFIVDGPITDSDGSVWYLAGIWDITGFISSTILDGIDSESTAEQAPVEESATTTIPWKQPIDHGVVADNSNDPLPTDGLACRVDVFGSADVIVHLGQGQSVEVVGQEVWSEGIEFLPVNCGGQGGYVKADYVALNSETALEPVAEEPPADAEEDVTEEVASEDVAAQEVVDEPEADAPTVGDLIVTVTDGNGVAVAGACFDLYSADGWVAHACDSTDAIPNNGNSGFFGVPAGSYTIVAASAPEGVAIPDLEATVVAGDTSYTGATATTAVVEEPLAAENSTDEAAAEDLTDEVAAENLTENLTDEVAAESLTDEVVTEDLTEEVVTENLTDEVVSEDLTEEVVTENLTDEVVTEDLTEEVVTEDLTDEIVTEDLTEEVVTENLTDEPASGPDLSRALGDATVTGTNGDGVRCRVAPDATSATITVLAEGATVFVLEEPNNGYLGVACANQLGYADIEFMWAGGAGDEIPASASSVVVVGTGGMMLNCRSGPGAHFGVVNAVSQGSVLTARGASSNGWAPVVCGGMNGFVSIAFVEVTGGNSGSGSGGNTTASASGTGTVTNTGGDGLRCRTSANGSIITVLPEGTRVTTRGAASGGWVPVVCAGMNGFVSAQFFTVGASSPGSGNNGGGASSGFVRVTGTGGASLNCRTAASMSGMVITAIRSGSTVEVRGAASNGWQPVTCAGRNGYVSTTFVTATTNPGSGNQDSDDSEPVSGQTGTARVANTGGDGLRCRTAPNGSVITVLAEGASVGTRGASSNGWTPVLCGLRNGFVSSMYLSTGGGSTTPNPTPNPGTSSGLSNGDHGRVTVRANMRYQASMGANVVIVVDSGEVLRITGNATNGFYPVDYDGLRGFMSVDLLSKTSAALSKRGGSAAPSPAPDLPSPGGGTATGNSIVNYAMRYVGYPYVWATSGPSSFDCSGFTNWVIKNVVGKNIGTGLWTQWAAGFAVSRSSLQLGDLLFFQNTYKPGLSHVGIYIGNNQFVHAENANTGVRVSDLNSSYYGSRWLGARRVH